MAGNDWFTEPTARSAVSHGSAHDPQRGDRLPAQHRATAFAPSRHARARQHFINFTKGQDFGSLGMLSTKPLKQVSRSSSSFVNRHSPTALAFGALGFGAGAMTAS